MMKSTGMVRKTDDLSRIVIPREICRELGIEPRTPLEIYVDGEKIIFRKHEPGCILCGNAEDVVNYKGKNFCPECLAGIAKKVG